MIRILTPLAGIALVVAIAPFAVAQPASKFNERGMEHAAPADQCKSLHDDYIKQKQWLDAKPADRDDGKHKGKDKADKTEKREEKDLDKMLKDYERSCGKPTADMTAGAIPSAGLPAAAAPTELPRKAGPAHGTHASNARCDQLHKALVDSLVRKDACSSKEKGCRKAAEDDYAMERTAYRAECGDLPADAVPAKGKGGKG